MLILMGVLAGLGIVILVGAFIFWAPRPAEPKLDSTVTRLSLKVGDASRDYIAVVPANLAPGAPLWVVLHGASSNAEQMRFITGYQFEERAARDGFVVVYPDGYKHSWHDGRTATTYPARTEGVDDVRFLNLLTSDLVKKHGLDPQRVYGFGYSNGGHMLFKMAAQSPRTFAALVAVAANMSEPESCDNVSFSARIPVMLVEGTKDPLNPYSGGTAGNRRNSLGQVKSALGSAEAFAMVNGVGGSTANYDNNSVDGAPERTLVAGHEGKRKSVVLKEFGARSTAPVRLYTVKGGGHVVPNSVYRAPRIMGRSTKLFDAPIAACVFAEKLEQQRR